MVVDFNVRSGGFSNAFGNSFENARICIAEVSVKSPCCTLEMSSSRDNVGSRAGIECSDADNGRLKRVDFSLLLRLTQYH